MAFIPTENDDQSSLAMSVLAQAMMEEGVVAIVRLDQSDAIETSKFQNAPPPGQPVVAFLSAGKYFL